MTLIAPSLAARSRDDTQGIIWTSIGLVYCAQIYLALSSGLHWDEFYHYNLIIKFNNGELTSTLQSFFVQYLQWIPGLPGDVIDHVRGIRILMLFCEAGTIFALYGLAQTFTTKHAAALICLFYITGGFVTTRGAFFRADPQITLLLMTALWILACRLLNTKAILSLATLCGLAGIISIKVVFYLPAFLGITLYRIRHTPQKAAMAIRVTISVLLCFVVFWGFYKWHANSLGVSASVEAATSKVNSAGTYVFSSGFFPTWYIFKYQALNAPHIIILFFLTLWTLRKPDVVAGRKVARFLLLLPASTLLFYQNSYPYFYAFLLPPILIAMAPALEKITRRRMTTSLLVMVLTFWGLALIFVPNGYQREALRAQKEFLNVAYRLFPEPVSYFDVAGVLGFHDRVMPFLPSRMGRTGYKQRGVPLLADILHTKPVPLVIANYLPFNKELGNPAPSEYWLPEDAAVLDTSYIHHWGPIWVAGKTIKADAKLETLEILIPGNYTLEGGDLELDSILHNSGDVIWLDRGTYRVSATGLNDVVLRWGEHLEHPTETPPDPFPFVPRIRVKNPS